MTPLRVTPRLSQHARERCREMGVRTKRVKRMVRSPDLTRPSRDLTVAVRDDDPDIAAIFDARKNPPVVVTVVWRTAEEYDR